MKQYEKLSIELIDEGRFTQQANDDLVKMQQDLMKYVHQHAEQAKGAKAKLTMEVTLAVENVKDEHFSIKSQTKVIPPNRPAAVTLAIGDASEDGGGRLFVRRGGSDGTTPRQGKMFTDDGRKIPEPPHGAFAAGELDDESE